MAVASERVKGGTVSGTASARTVSVSVIIPVRNEERMIGRCLQALADIDFPHERLQVVVVDNGSTDRTAAIVQTFADRLDLEILQRPGVRISALRNVGARASRGDILAFLDADCLVSRDWLSVAAGLIAEHGDAVLGSDYAIPPNSTWVARAWYAQPLPAFAPVNFVPSGDLLVARAAFDRIGGFNESIQTNEDCEFCLRARLKAIPVYASAALAVTHLGTPQTASSFFAKQRWHGTHVFRVFRRNVSTLQNAKPLAFAAAVLVGGTGIVAGVAWAAFTRNIVPLLTFATVLIALVLGLAMQKALVQQKRAANIIPLFALFFLYGTARAVSLLNPRNW